MRTIWEISMMTIQIGRIGPCESTPYEREARGTLPGFFVISLQSMLNSMQLSVFRVESSTIRKRTVNRPPPAHFYLLQ